VDVIKFKKRIKHGICTVSVESAGLRRQLNPAEEGAARDAFYQGTDNGKIYLNSPLPDKADEWRRTWTIMTTWATEGCVSVGELLLKTSSGSLSGWIESSGKDDHPGRRRDQPQVLINIAVVAPSRSSLAQASISVYGPDQPPG
jgi:hypothetical protein